MRATLDPVVTELHNLLLDRQLTIATAESCTGGLLGAALTTLSGSSSYYLGGIISYANKAKSQLLGVAPEDIATYGAVSEVTALAMAKGAQSRFETDLAIATTGIAGPTGGTPNKPVGTIWIAFATATNSWAECLNLKGTRDQNRLDTCRYALEKLVASITSGQYNSQMS